MGFSFLFKVQHYLVSKHNYMSRPWVCPVCIWMLSCRQCISQRLLLVHVNDLWGFTVLFTLMINYCGFQRLIISALQKRCPVQIVWFPFNCLFGSSFVLTLWDNVPKMALCRLCWRVELCYKIFLLIPLFFLNSTSSFFFALYRSPLPCISCLDQCLMGWIRSQYFLVCLRQDGYPRGWADLQQSRLCEEGALHQWNPSPS